MTQNRSTICMTSSLQRILVTILMPTPPTKTTLFLDSSNCLGHYFEVSSRTVTQKIARFTWTRKKLSHLPKKNSATANAVGADTWSPSAVSFCLHSEVLEPRSIQNFLTYRRDRPLNQWLDPQAIFFRARLLLLSRPSDEGALQVYRHDSPRSRQSRS